MVAWPESHFKGADEGGIAETETHMCLLRDRSSQSILPDIADNALWPNIIIVSSNFAL